MKGFGDPGLVWRSSRCVRIDYTIYSVVKSEADNSKQVKRLVEGSGLALVARVGPTEEAGSKRGAKWQTVQGAAL